VAEAAAVAASASAVLPLTPLRKAFSATATSALIVANLLYLVRRSLWREPRLGSLQAWMTSHVATGILAILSLGVVLFRLAGS